jgi:hypothetical protein
LLIAALSCRAARAAEPEDVAGSEGAVELVFQMPCDGYATLALYYPNGDILRPLAQLLELTRGRHCIRWDGLDLWGHPVPAGAQAVLRVITHPGLRAYYEFGACAPNKIPWPSQRFGEGEEARTGGWLGDHSPPWCITTTGSRVFLGCPVAEHGHNIIYTNLDGEKMWGGKLRGWSGPEYLTNDGKHVYAIPRGRAGIVRMDLNCENMATLVDTKGRAVKALSVWDGKMYLTLPGAPPEKPDDKTGARQGGKAARKPAAKAPAAAPLPVVLEIRDAASGQLIREIGGPEADIALMVHDPAGKIYSIVGARLCRTEISGQSIRHTVLNETDLAAPISLAVDRGRGERIAVGDEQKDAVLVFDPRGKLTLTVGGVGPRKPGPWDPHTVDRPMGVAFDARGKIWVVENYFVPKRVTRFSAEGKFEQVHFGPPMYGGGGFLDPDLKSFYYCACQYALDWEQGATRLVNLNDKFGDPMSPDLHSNGYAYTKLGRPIYYRDRRYVVGDAGWQYNPGFAVCLLEGPIFRPCAGMGPAEKSGFLLNKECWKAHWQAQDLKGKSFIWCDRNDDGGYQVEEVELVNDADFGRGGPFASAYWGNRCGADLTFWGPNARLAPSRFTEKGAPIYEARNLQPFNYYSVMPGYPRLRRGETNITQVTQDGCLVTGGQPYRVGPDLKIRGGQAGVKPSDYVPPVPGEMSSGLSYVGDVLTQSPLGELGVLNGSGGVWYVVSMKDNLLVGKCFTGKEGNWSSLYPKRGMEVTHYRHDGETFFGDFIKAHNGNYYAVAGKGFHAVCRIEGMDEFAVTELPVEVSAAQAQANAALRPVLAARAAGLARMGRSRPSLACPTLARRTKNFKLDGDLSDWGVPAKMPMLGRKDEKLSFDLAHDATGLYVAYSGLSFPGNAADDVRFVFNTGFALDLRVRRATGRGAAVEGDRRLVFAEHKGRWVGVLYDYVNPGARAGEGFVFTSPVGSTRVARIAQLPEDSAKIAFKCAELKLGRKCAWTAEVFVKWDVLGLSPAENPSFRADFGILGADSGGIQTARRAFWSSPSMDEVTDVPSEAAMHGDTLGTVTLGK